MTRPAVVKMLIDGVWRGDVADTPDLKRRRSETAVRWFRDRVAADGSSAFRAEPGRYHLYVSYACPWAHRTILYRRLKGLEGVVSMSVLHPRWGGPEGWCFGDTPMSTVDHAGGRHYLYEVYQASKPDYTGKVTVPALYDKASGRIVNNASLEIIRMLNSEFDAWGDPRIDFRPADLAGEIDEVNAWLLPDVCEGVYATGFAATQDDYDTAIERLFGGLDRLERMLGDDRPYLLGDRLTEPDWHLFVTTVRHDAAYYEALRCNLRRLCDYPKLSAHLRRLGTLPGVAETVRIDHVKRHYYDTLGEVNPEIVPARPLSGITPGEARPEPLGARV